MNVVVLNTIIPFCRGGAEALAEDLVSALRQAGHRAELVTIPFKWYPQSTLVKSIMACKLIDLNNYVEVPIDKVIALKFPAWYIPHKDKSFWILHQHRTAYDLWDTEYSDVKSMPDGEHVRDLISHSDTNEISQSETVCTISETVSSRLMKYNGIKSSVLYPPPKNMDQFRCDDYGDYLFFPSRINPLKRQELIIQALEDADDSVKVVFSGEADDKNYLDSLKSLAKKIGVESKIVWKGYVSEEEKISLYSNCLMVVFPPYDEDYGYVTPEAMLSSKGVITLSDSGGALEFIDHGINGYIVEPDKNKIAAVISEVYTDREKAKTLGMNAKRKINKMDLSWSKVIDGLI
jgi:glycosyltransferase involved in cell wall biosynthesis